MFQKAKTRVNWNNQYSLPIQSTHGVLQGGVSNLKFFNEFLSDLNEYLDPTCGVKIDRKLLLYLLFADDMILFSKSANDYKSKSVVSGITANFGILL